MMRKYLSPLVLLASAAVFLGCGSSDGGGMGGIGGTAGTGGDAGSGGVGGSGGTGGQVPSKVWGTPMLLETLDQEIGSQHVALGQDGDGFAVWTQSDGTSAQVWANRFNPNVGWQGGVPITIGVRGPTAPRVTVDAEGNAIAAWRDRDIADYMIRANRYVATVGWGAAQAIEGTRTTFADQFLRLAGDAQGNAVAVWHQFDGAIHDVWANVYSPVDGWGAAELLEDNDLNSAREPAVTMDPDGNAMAVWSEFPLAIQSRRYAAVGDWDPVEPASQEDRGSQPDVGIDAEGRAIAVWGRNGRLSAATWSLDDDWGTPDVLDNGEGVALRAKIGMSADGNAVAVWAQRPSGGMSSIWAASYALGSGWSAPSLVEHDDAGDAESPEVAVDARGNAVVVWRQSDGVRFDAWSNRFTVGNGWGEPELLEEDEAGDVLNPEVAMDPSGNAIAVWRSFDGLRNNLWANRLEEP